MGCVGSLRGLVQARRRASDPAPLPAEVEAGVRRIVVAAAWAAAVTVTVQSVATLATRIAFDSRFDSIDATLETNVWTWASSGATLVAGAGAAAVALVRVAAALRLFLLAGTLAFFSLDDWLQFHERVGNRLVDVLALPSYVGGLWVLTYPPLLAVAFIGLVLTAWESHRPIRLALLTASLLLVAAVAVELLGVPTKALAEARGIDWPHDVRSTIEEALELAGWMLAAGGMTAALLAAGAGRERPSSWESSGR